MSRCSRFLPLIVAVMLVLVFSPVLAGDLDKLRWLEGTWKRDSSRGVVYERWRVLSDKTFVGESWRESSSGERRPGESLLLVEMGGGTALTVWIEGPGEGDEPRRIEFHFKRVD